VKFKLPIRVKEKEGRGEGMGDFEIEDCGTGREIQQTPADDISRSPAILMRRRG